MENVFVYGTLRKGSFNHSLISSEEFVAEGSTRNKYKLISNNIPYVIKDEERVSTIKGEIYKVTDEVLEILDRLEGHPDWYRREKTMIDTNKGSITAWLYFYPKEYSYTSRVISSGDFLNP